MSAISRNYTSANQKHQKQPICMHTYETPPAYKLVLVVTKNTTPLRTITQQIHAVTYTWAYHPDTHRTKLTENTPKHTIYVSGKPTKTPKIEQKQPTGGGAE